MQKLILAIVTIGFGILTGLAVYFDGVLAIFEAQFKSFGTAQVFVDLIISLGLILVWIWRDAKSKGRNPWIWLFITLAIGCFGPLFYLLTDKSSPNS